MIFYIILCSSLLATLASHQLSGMQESTNVVSPENKSCSTKSPHQYTYYTREVKTEAIDRDYDFLTQPKSLPIKKCSDLYYAIIENDKDAFTECLSAASYDELVAFRNYPRRETLAHVAIARHRNEMFCAIMRKVTRVEARGEENIATEYYVNARAHFGCTMIYYAVAHQNKDALSALLKDSNADVQIQDNDGVSPLVLAIRLQKGVSRQVAQCFGYAPMSAEEKRNRGDIIKALSEYHLKVNTDSDILLLAHSVRHYIEKTLIPIVEESVEPSLPIVEKKRKREFFTFSDGHCYISEQYLFNPNKGGKYTFSD